MDSVSVVVKERSPYLLVSDESGISGAMQQMLNYVSRSMKFNVSLKTNNQYGNPKDGVWNGMIGMLLNKQVDLALTPTTISLLRQSVIQFSTPVFTSEKTLLVGRPPLRPSLFAVLSAFDRTSSNLFVLGLIVTLTVSIICNKIVHQHGLGVSLSVIDQIWLLLEIVLSKSSIGIPKSLWSRILLCSWMLPVIVITSIISSRLISALSIGHSFEQIKIIDDLLRFPHIQPLFSGGSSEADYFERIVVSPFSDIWKRAQSMRGSFRDAKELESDEILTGVENNKFVIINDKSTFESCLVTRYQKYKKCNFHITKSYLSSYLGVMYRKDANANFVENINHRILVMVQYGLLDYLAQKNLKGLDICLNMDRTPAVEQNTIIKMSGIFIMWAFGVSISFCEFSMEVLVNFMIRVLKQRKRLFICKKNILKKKLSSKNFRTKFRIIINK